MTNVKALRQRHDRAIDLLELEQQHLWNDLNNDVRMAINGVWSIAAESRAWRIVRIARFIGPTDWVDVPLSLLMGGVYQAILKKAGFEDFDPTPEELAPYVDRYSGSVERWAPTVAHILSDQVNLENDEV